MNDRYMSTFLGAVGLLAILGCTQPRLTPDPPPLDPERAALGGQLIDSLAAAQRLPGFAVTASVGRRVIWRHAVGFADVAARKPATTAMQIRVGSVSKLLTATLLMRLAQTGQIDLDSPVGAVIAAPVPLASVTLRQLAGHLGGVRHYRGNEFLTNTPYSNLSDALATFLNDSLVALPGTRYAYSSYGYNLVGAVLEHQMHTPFPDLMRRHVLEPLELGATTPDNRSEPHPNRAHLYMVSRSDVSDVPEDDLSGRWPSGGYLSSTDDLARFGRSVLAPGLLNDASLRTMLTPQRLASGTPTAVGIGWRIGADSALGPYYHHGGTSNGGSAFILVLPSHQLVIAMGSNALAQLNEREVLRVARLLVP